MSDYNWRQFWMPLTRGGFEVVDLRKMSNDSDRLRFCVYDDNRYHTFNADAEGRISVEYNHQCDLLPVVPAQAEMSESLCAWCKQPKAAHTKTSRGDFTDQKLCPVDGVTSQFYTPMRRESDPDPLLVEARRLFNDGEYVGPDRQFFLDVIARLETGEKTRIPRDKPDGSTSITKVTMWVIDGGNVEREILQSDSSDYGRAEAFQRAKRDLLKIRDEIQWLLDNGEKLCPFSPSFPLIAAERQRQVSVEGWTAEHDCGQLALAAVCYAAYAAGERVFRVAYFDGGYSFVDPWPWDESLDKRDIYSDSLEDDPPEPTEQQRREHTIRCLVKAGALIAADIDRLQRKAVK